MRTLLRPTALGVALFLLGRPLSAQECQTLLSSLAEHRPGESPEDIHVLMTTLNTKNVASYVETRLPYMPPRTRPIGRSLPARFVTLAANALGIDRPKFDFGLAVQVFSDRTILGQPLIGTHVGLPHHGLQKFDEHQADDVDMQITVTPPVTVTVTSRTWNDTRTFVPICDAGGFMYGSTPDVKYLLRISKWPPAT